MQTGNALMTAAKPVRHARKVATTRVAGAAAGDPAIPLPLESDTPSVGPP